MKNEKIVLKGQAYATPQTESVEIKNQGVLCGSVVSLTHKANLSGYSAGTGF